MSFFIQGLGQSILGRGWYEGALSGPQAPPGARGALAWLHPLLFDPAYVERVQAAFAAEPDVPHVCLERPLQAERANEIAAALARASFTRHHHPGYEISVARKELQRERSALTAFVEWLESREAASLHCWLAGCLLPADLLVQVQVARALRGDHFPRHEDTSRPGIAAVYNLTPPDWRPDEFGGVLRFMSPLSGRQIIRVPPRFNSVMIFRPRNAPHEVTEVLPAAGDRARYTITAFFVDRSAKEG